MVPSNARARGLEMPSKGREALAAEVGDVEQKPTEAYGRRDVSF